MNELDMRICEYCLTEQKILESKSFLERFSVALHMAKHQWCGEIMDFPISMTTITGEVAVNKPFSIVNSDDEIVIFAALRTEYNGRKLSQIRIVAQGIASTPFIIEKSAAYLVFAKPFLVLPEEFLSIEMIAGDGVLNFRLVGKTINKFRGVRGADWSAYQIQQIPENQRKIAVVEENGSQRVKAMIDCVGEK